VLGHGDELMPKLFEAQAELSGTSVPLKTSS
jgi:hypothetical protein